VSTVHLLDANALIALSVTDHEHHDVASRWAATTERFAVCPVVEGALVRFLVRVGEGPATAVAVLSALHEDPRSEFWEDSISYVTAGLDHVVGHRQVTDAYLAALAASRGGRLATFDQGLVEALPDTAVLIG
jgi:uncharacterized protein